MKNPIHKGMISVAIIAMAVILVVVSIPHAPVYADENIDPGSTATIPASEGSDEALPPDENGGDNTGDIIGDGAEEAADGSGDGTESGDAAIDGGEIVPGDEDIENAAGDGEAGNNDVVSPDAAEENPQDQDSLDMNDSDIGVFGEIDALGTEGIIDGFNYVNVGSDNDNYYDSSVGLGVYITGYVGTAKIPVVPAMVEGVPVVSVDLWSSKQKTFTAIDFDAAAGLKSLNLGSITLSNTLNLVNNRALESISLQTCKLSGINLTGLTALKLLYFWQCDLPSLVVQSNTNLESLTISNVFQLSGGSGSMGSVKNTVTSLDLSKNTLLKELVLEGTKLTALDLGANNELTNFTLSTSSVKSLDLCGKTKLQYLKCNQNSKLTSIDISGCGSLGFIWLNANALKTIDVNSIPDGMIWNFYISNNNISDPVILNALISKLRIGLDESDWAYDYVVTSVLPQKNVQYLVNFNSMGGTEVASKSIKKGGSLGTLQIPTMSENLFAGWYPTEDGGVKATASTKPKGNPGIITYYALWGAACDVTFNANGGAPDSRTIQIQENNKLGKAIPTAKRTGYSLDGWYTAPIDGFKINANTVVSGSATYYAQWKANTYELTFNAGGGNVSTKTGTVTFDASYGAAFGGTLPVPTRTGYDFDGWWTAKDTSPLPGTGDAGDLVDSPMAVKLTKSATLYAHWTARNYTVTFDLNKDVFGLSDDVGFATGSGDTKTGTVYFGQAFGSAIPVTENKNISEPYYTQTGWYTVAGKTGGAKITAATKVNFQTDDRVYYARWTEAFKVTWVVTDLGGTGVDSFDTYVAKTTKKVGTLPAAVSAPPGYALKGWYTTPTGVGKVTKNTIVSANVTYYSLWKPATFKVTYDRMDGVKPPKAKSVTYLSAYGKLAAPKRAGYVFDGWWTGNGTPNWGIQVSATTQVAATGAHTLYAKWVPRNDIVVKFNVNGGSALSPADAQRNVTFASTIGSLPVPTRADSAGGKSYIFKGWYTKKTGGVQVTSGTAVDFTKTRTYYAQWITAG